MADLTLADCLDPERIFFADQADAALELLRFHYCDLLLRHDSLLKRHELLERASFRILEVLAAMEKKHETAINI